MRKRRQDPYKQLFDLNPAPMFVVDEETLELVDVGRYDIGDPLHFPAPLVPIPRQLEMPEIVVLEDNGVDALLFAKSKSREDALLGGFRPVEDDVETDSVVTREHEWRFVDGLRAALGERLAREGVRP